MIDSWVILCFPVKKDEVEDSESLTRGIMSFSNTIGLEEYQFFFFCYWSLNPCSIT
jgi:hypothetical protein